MDAVVLYQIIVALCSYTTLQLQMVTYMYYLKHKYRDVAEADLNITQDCR